MISAGRIGWQVEYCDSKIGPAARLGFVGYILACETLF